MRWLGSLVACVCVGAVGAGIAKTYKDRLDQAHKVEMTVNAVARVQRELSVRIATGDLEKNERGFPGTIDPAWFDAEEPVNALLDDAHPWLEVAATEDAELDHPAVRVALSSTTAGLWYNPYRGVIRARVPVAVSDDEALRTYNRVNGTAIPSLFWREPPPLPPDATYAESLRAGTPGSHERGTASSSTLKRGLKNSNPMRRQKKQPLIVVHHQPTAAPQTAPSPTSDNSPQTASAPE